jgi:hypothetical protein
MASRRHKINCAVRLVLGLVPSILSGHRMRRYLLDLRTARHRGENDCRSRIACAKTIGPKTHIRRCDDESAKCSGSSRLARLSGFSVHAAVHNTSNFQRHLVSRSTLPIVHANVLQGWPVTGVMASGNTRNGHPICATVEQAMSSLPSVPGGAPQHCRTGSPRRRASRVFASPLAAAIRVSHRTTAGRRGRTAPGLPAPTISRSPAPKRPRARAAATAETGKAQP